MTRHAWDMILAFVRRERMRFMARGLDVVETTRRSLLSMESRVGAAVFAVLFFVGHMQSPPVLPPLDMGPAYAHLAATAFPELIVFRTFLFFLHLVAGAVLGIFLHNAWDILEGIFPSVPNRYAWPRRWFWVSIAAVLLFMHGGFLLGAMRAAPSLYTPAFHACGGPLRWFQDWGTSGLLSIPARLWTWAAWGLLLAGLVQMGRRFSAWFRAFPVPTRIASIVIGAGTFLFVIGLWGVFRFHRPSNGGPNVVVLAVEGLRSEQVRDIEHAPVMNLLSRRGWAFSSCVPTVPSRAPALMTLLTGRSPLSHGVRHAFPSAGDVRMSADALPAYLKSVGYETAALSDAGGDFVGRLSRSFDRVRAPDGSVPGTLRRDELRRSVHLLPYACSGWARRILPALRGIPELMTPRVLMSETEGWLKQLRFEERFFLLVHLTGVRETAAIDDAVATLLEGLDAVGVGDSTWMVLWSPFAADADGTPNNGAEVSSSARFAGPLIIAGPSHRPSPSWQRFPVRDIDVAPTLLEAMGLPVPETMEGIPLLGVDAEPGAAFLRDIYTESDLWLSPDDNPLPAAVRLDYGPPSHWLEEDPEEPGRLRVRPDVEDVALAARHRLFQTDGERVIYRPTRNGVVFEYYDLRNDPSAETNLAGTKDGAQRVKDLKETFFQELRREIGWRPQNDFWIPEAFMRKKS